MDIKKIDNCINQIVSVMSSSLPRLVWSNRETILGTIEVVAEEIEKEPDGKDSLVDFGKAKSHLRTDIALAPEKISKPDEMKKLRASLNNFILATQRVVYEEKGIDSDTSWMVQEEEREEEGEISFSERVKNLSEGGDLKIPMDGGD